MSLLKKSHLFPFLCLCLLTVLTPHSVHASLESEQVRLAELQQVVKQAQKKASLFDGEITTAKEKVAAEQAEVKQLQAVQDEAQAILNDIQTQYDINPNTDLERQLKDAEYQVMLTTRKTNSASKGVDRAERKLAELNTSKKKLQAKVSPAKAEVAAQETLLEEMQSQEWLAAQEKAKAAKDKAEEEIRLAAEAEAKAKAAQLAKEQAAVELQEQFGIDENCVALPNEADNTVPGFTTLDQQVQAFAKGELRRVNRLIAEAPAEDTPPFAEAPSLAGNKLNPCNPDQKQMLTFSYIGNNQYRLETRVLAGEQEFWVSDVVAPMRRIVQPEDNGELYTFFLDVKNPGRYKLVGYKKALFE